MSTENEVRKASALFYAALNQMANGNAGAMATAWSQDGNVSTMHPIGGCDVGWDIVSASFGNVAELAANGKIELRDQRILAGSDMAYETGTERGSFTMAGTDVSIEHRVTNVYRKVGGDWKIVHHHTDISPAMMDVLSRL